MLLGVRRLVEHSHSPHLKVSTLGVATLLVLEQQQRLGLEHAGHSIGGNAGNRSLGRILAEHIPENTGCIVRMGPELDRDIVCTEQQGAARE